MLSLRTCGMRSASKALSSLASSDSMMVVNKFVLFLFS
ncbi:hypothetical protein KMB89_gp46 [Citrobacter phage HCF1]|uniref:Uncharacterized protein n=1 Tax=Citrobacter phage HCF1 TaxID=2849700 RepID=A0ABX6D3P3_9CAUD|nr:hypothetical protein KMB89_gp46 [Citrobacter phage HCF1]